MKLELDKYYTPDNVAEYCFNKTIQIIGKKNITNIIESSAGNGIFLKYMEESNLPYIALDIQPENEDILEADFLSFNFNYGKGYLIGFNPPFGDLGCLMKAFYKKAIQLGDYISFILPITQLNNSNSLYEFDLIYSEDLGIIKFSNKDVHCCLNIYSS